MTEVRTPAAGPLRDMWTRITIDPVAVPLVRWLAPHRVVTPNRITGVAVVCAGISAVCFATGHLRLGGLAYIARFFADSIDGMVARLQGTSSRIGAAFDLAADVAGIAVIIASLGWYLSREAYASSWLGLCLLAGVVFYNWALTYRKDLARQAAIGDGGAQHRWQTNLPVVRSWVALTSRWGMAPIPWAVEAEIAVLGLSPLLLPAHLLAYPLAAGIGFYLLAGAVNMRRIWRIAGHLDSATQASRHGGDHAH